MNQQKLLKFCFKLIGVIYLVWFGLAIIASIITLGMNAVGITPERRMRDAMVGSWEVEGIDVVTTFSNLTKDSNGYSVKRVRGPLDDGSYEEYTCRFIKDKHGILLWFDVEDGGRLYQSITIEGDTMKLWNLLTVPRNVAEFKHRHIRDEGFILHRAPIIYKRKAGK